MFFISNWIDLCKIKTDFVTKYSSKSRVLSLQDDKFYMVAVIERGSYPSRSEYLPAHQISLETPLLVCNYLPTDINYTLNPEDSRVSC